MPKVYSAKKLLAYFLRCGCEVTSKKGSHRKLRTPEGNILILPMHSRDLPYGTFCAMLEQGGFEKKKVIEELGK